MSFDVPSTTCPSFRNVAEGAREGTEKVLESAVVVKKDVGALFSALKLTNYIYTGVELAKGCSPHSVATRFHASAGTSVIDVFDNFSVFDYWINGRFKESDQNGWTISATVANTIGTFGGTYLWGGELGFYDCAKVSAGLGKVPVIGQVVNAFSSIGLSMVRIVAGANILEWGLSGINSFISILNAKNGAQLAKGMIDTARYVFAVASQLVFLFAGSCILAIIIFGIISTSCGVISPIYKHFNSEAFK
jgi:hypothetical protein